MSGVALMKTPIPIEIPLRMSHSNIYRKHVRLPRDDNNVEDTPTIRGSRFASDLPHSAAAAAARLSLSSDIPHTRQPATMPRSAASPGSQAGPMSLHFTSLVLD